MLMLLIGILLGVAFTLALLGLTRASTDSPSDLYRTSDHALPPLPLRPR